MITDIARKALPLMTPAQRVEAEAILEELRTANAVPVDLAKVKADAARAFEADMRPVVDAVVSALQAGDVHALRGLRALLPTLLAEVNANPTLVDLLALQLGTAVLASVSEPIGSHSFQEAQP